MLLTSWLASVKGRVSRSFAKGKTAKPRKRYRGEVRSEQLESRAMLAFNFVAALKSPAGDDFFSAADNVQGLHESPSQITLRFTAGSSIDPATIAANISVVRSGGFYDAFGAGGSSPDLPVAIGYVGRNDNPNVNEIVVRFAQPLVDDAYEVRMLRNLALEPTPGGPLVRLNQGLSDSTFRFKMDRGAQVVAVVPQPITRGPGGALSQARDVVNVYFNQNDPLNSGLAENPQFYSLIDSQTGARTAATSVVYTAANGLAVVTFPSGAIADGRTFRMQVGTYTAPLGDVVTAETENNSVVDLTGDNSSFDPISGQAGTGAQSLNAGVPLGNAAVTLSGRIAPKNPSSVVGSDLLQTPPQIGGADEPGHRTIPTESHGAGSGTTPADASSASVVTFTFPAQYGTDPNTGAILSNAIKEEQKTMARQIFQLFSYYSGIRFQEVDGDDGNSSTLDNVANVNVVTGDVRGTSGTKNLPPNAVGGVAAGSIAIMNANSLANDVTYGGGWFGTALHEIGHVLGLGHAYDIPSTQSSKYIAESVYSGDYDFIHLNRLYPKDGADIDVYKFTLDQPGTVKINATAALRAAGASQLDTVLTLYRQRPDGTREMIARNDDFNNTDSYIELGLTDVTTTTTFFVAVTSAGNTDINPEVPNSGGGGRTDGVYDLRVSFESAASKATIKDLQGTEIDGDADGKAGGAYNFWFNTASTANTLIVDKMAAAGGNGSLATPYNTISAALAVATPGRIVRIVGNGGTDGNAATPADARPYLIGTELIGNALSDGATFNIPAGVTVMIDQDAVLKFRAANLDVGSSTSGQSRAGATLQVLGTPGRQVYFTSFHNDGLGGDSDNVGPVVSSSQWGGIVFRGDSDSTLVEPNGTKAFVNTVAQANITYGGGQVLVNGQLRSFTALHLDSARFDNQPVSGTRPTLMFNTLQFNAGAGISADPNAFDDRLGRIGPDIHGNFLNNNTTNGLSVRIDTNLGQTTSKLDVPARFRSTDITYTLSENLTLSGGAGGLDATSGTPRARSVGRLMIDPGVVVKLNGARIEMERGPSQLIAEGSRTRPIIFTSLDDPRYGSGGTFNTNGVLPDIDPATGTILNPSGTAVSAAGRWGGLVFNATSSGSIDNAYIAFAGGLTSIEGGSDNFNPVEIVQANVRIANSRFDTNAGGRSTSDRNGRGQNTAATIYVRGAQPIILNNDFFSNLGTTISIDANSMKDVVQGDSGRTTGGIDRSPQYDSNYGPLLRGNRMSSDGTRVPPGQATLGVTVRGDEITTGAIWDDTDIVHFLNNQIIVQNFHTNTYQRLQSSPTASLVVKLSGGQAGFVAAGFPLDIDDRIGGTVQILGQPGYPVVMTDIRDDSVGASFGLDGLANNDSNADGTATVAAPGGWSGIRLERFSNDRNVAVYNERESAERAGGVDRNSQVGNSENLGILAPNANLQPDYSDFDGVISTWNTANPANLISRAMIQAGYANDFASLPSGAREMVRAVQETKREKGGDDNRRMGFEIHGYIQTDTPTDVDLYQFSGTSGTEVWIDIDKTSPSLDTVVELLKADGTVVAASTNSQRETAPSGNRLPLTKDSWRGGDYWGTNAKDAGFRVILPGTRGQTDVFYIRVRSTPIPGVDPLAVTNAGATEGKYQVQVRLNQRDEVPGSTVQYADIRYATSAITVVGLPRSSPLLGESAERPSGTTFGAGAQDLGNLLQTDRNTISVSGSLSAPDNVDWYTFDLDYDLIQSIGGVNGGAKTWATVFDIDYADGIARPDTTLSVFDSSGRLILISRDGAVTDDQPGPGQGVSFDDLSRGSFGVQDPFIGPVQMPTGTPNASFSSGSQTGVVPGTRPTNHPFRYYVAISSDQRVPSALNATFFGAALNSSIRLEPVNSIRRIAEDHIGTSGYTSAGKIAPLVPTLIDTSTAQRLNTNVTPFQLEDVTLFVSTSNATYTADPFRGGQETFLTSYSSGTSGDLEMRPDGRLFQAWGATNDAANVATIREVDTGNGSVTTFGSDGVANQPTTPTAWNLTSDNVDALTIRRTGVGQYVDEIYYSLRSGPSTSRLYRGRTTGSATFDTNNPQFSYRGDITGGGITGLTTGLQFVQDSGATLYGVSSGGQFYTINAGSGAATLLADFSTATGSGLLSGGEGFQGLAAGPQNVEGGRFRGMLFAITSQGRLVCLNPNTGAALANVFDTNSDGVGDSAISNATINGATGLAFSPLDINLWHPTLNRRGDTGHGINAAFDNTRAPTANPVSHTTGSLMSRTGDEGEGGMSMWFGFEEYTNNPANSNQYMIYPDPSGTGNQFGQYGAISSNASTAFAGESYNWQQELSVNTNIGATGARLGNYNLPGGAYGSLVTGSFSLAGYAASSKPTLYFDYFLEAQITASNGSGMRDAARAYISSDGGLTWQLLATNNSTASALGTTNAELPAFQSVSSTASTMSNQRVQELFDNTGSWRQARVDLSGFVGNGNLKLRFDFTTSGNMDPAARRQIDGTGGQDLLNSISGRAADSGNFNSPERGQSNDFEGFYIDDIIIGFAERGEMVTGAQAGQTDFFNTALPTDNSVPTKQLTGPYQLSIRRGTEFGVQPMPTKSDVAIVRQFDTDDRFVQFPAGSTATPLLDVPLSGTTTIGNGAVNTIDTSAPGLLLPGVANGRVRSLPSVTTVPYLPPGTGGDTDATVTTIDPFDGSHALYMDAANPNAPIGGSLVSQSYATLRRDMTGVTSAYLTFAYNNLRTPTTTMPASFIDPSGFATPSAPGTIGTVVAMSNDGTNWFSLFTPVITFGAWQTTAIDLIAAARNAGLTPGANFRIRFQVATVTVPAVNGEPAQDGTFDTGSGIVFDSIRISPTPAIGSTGSIGDTNLIREQGQVILSNNIIRYSAQNGIDIDNTNRDPSTVGQPQSDIPRPGSVQNLPVQNNSLLGSTTGLVPGVVVVNNLITEGAIGIRMAGDNTVGNVPPASVAYARFVNNTIVGSTTGIRVTGNAAPTLANNLFSNAATSYDNKNPSTRPTNAVMTRAIDLQGTVAPGNTVVGTSVYHGVSAGTVGTNDITLPTATSPMFVSSLAGNFYLVQGSPAIDSSQNNVLDRPSIVSVLTAIGIPQSPIIAPERDLFNQLRGDDGSAGSFGGLGADVFKDRGAIERIDFTQPRLTLTDLVTTDSNVAFQFRTDAISGSWSGDPRLDQDTSANSMFIRDRSAGTVTSIRLQLSDFGVGIDKSTVLGSAFVVTRTTPGGGTITLTQGVDYTLAYHENESEIELKSASVFRPGTYNVTVTSTAASGLIPGLMTDLANNVLLPNRPDGSIQFSVTLLMEDPTLDQPLAATNGKLTIWEDQGQLGTHQPDSYTPNVFPFVGSAYPALPAGFPAVPLPGDTSVLVVSLTGITAGGLASNPPNAVSYDNRESQPLRVTAVSSLPSVLSVASPVTYVSPNSTGSIQLVVSSDQPLSAPTTVTITVTVTDAGFNGVFNNDPGSDDVDDQSVTRTFDVLVLPRNDLPLLTQPSDVNYSGIIPSGRVITVGGIAAGGGETQPLRVTAAVTGGTPGIVASPISVTYTSGAATADLTLLPFAGTPAFGVAGTVQVSVTVEDGGLDGDLSTAFDNSTTTRTFNVAFAPANADPNIDPIGDRNHLGWVPAQQVTLTGIGDPNPAHDLDLRADIQITGTAGMFLTAPTLTYNPATRTGRVDYRTRGDVTGTTVVTVRVIDSGVNLVPGDADDGITVRTFSIVQTGYNDPPVATADTYPIAPSLQLEDQPIVIPIAQLLSNDAVATNSPYTTTETQTPPAQTLTLVSVGSAVGGTVQIVGPNVVFTPTANLNGTATFTYVVRDNAVTNGADDFKTATGNVSISFTSVNDRPIRVNGPVTSSFNFLTSDPATPLGFETVDFLPGPTADESSQLLTITMVTVPNPLLGVLEIQGRALPVATGETLTIAELRRLQFRPNGSNWGASSFTLQVRDNGGTANGGVDAYVETFSLNVTTNVPYHHVGWIGQSSVSIVGEVIDTQPKQLFAPVYLVTWTGTAGMFLAGNAPSVTVDPITSLATVRYTTRGDKTGSATVTLRVDDLGPDLTAGTGDDSFAIFSFVVESVAYNDSPFANSDVYTLGGPAILEDSTLLIPISVLLANDRVASSSPYSTTETLTPPAQSLTITSVAPLTGGTPSIVGGNIRFVPYANFAGQASFSYTVRDNALSNGVDDSKSSIASVTFTYTPVNDPPFRFGPPGNLVLSLPQSLAVAPLGLATVEYIPGLGSAESSQSLYPYQVVTLPEPTLGLIVLSDGHTRVVAGQQLTLAELRGLQFRPAGLSVGNTAFQYLVRDTGGVANGGSDTLLETVSINVLAPEPVSYVGWEGPQSISFTGIGYGQEPGPYRLSVDYVGTSGAFLSGHEPAIMYDAPSAAANLAFTLRGDISSQGVIRVRIEDNGADGIAGTSDDGLTARVFAFNVTPYNDAPLVVDDILPRSGTAAYLEDQAILIPFAELLSNDRIASFSPYLTTEGSGGANQTLRVSRVLDSVGGIATFTQTGVLFTPLADFNGQASFAYEIEDNALANGLPAGKTGTAHVALTIAAVNDAPFAVPPLASHLIQTTDDQSNVSLGLQTATYFVGPDNERSSQTLLVTVTEVPDVRIGRLTISGGVTQLVPGMQFSAAQLATVRFQPERGATATGRFSYVVSDSGGVANGGRDRVTETITINVALGANSHPVLSRFLRAYNPSADYHFFTTNTSEFAAAIRGGYVDENTGRTGFSLIESADDRAVPVYRLYNFGTGRHYYTTNSAERDYLVGLVPQNSPDYGKRGWRNEGSEGQIYPTAQPGTIEVFRLYNRASGVHLYVESAAIRDAVLSSAPSIWEQHDSLGFAFFAPAGAAATAAPSFAAAAADLGASLAINVSPASSTAEPQDLSWSSDSGPDLSVGLVGPAFSGESNVAPDSQGGSIDTPSDDFGPDSSTGNLVETDDPNLDQLWTQITKSLTIGDLLDIV